jgi:hypothetical protein
MSVTVNPIRNITEDQNLHNITINLTWVTNPTNLEQKQLLLPTDADGCQKIFHHISLLENFMSNKVQNTTA